MYPRTTHLQCECFIIDVIRSPLPKNLTLTLTLIALTLTLSSIQVYILTVLYHKHCFDHSSFFIEYFFDGNSSCIKKST